MDKQRALHLVGTLLVSSALLLGGCDTSCDRYLKHPPTVPVIPLVEIKKPINPIQRREYDLCVLRSHGMQVIRVGQTWKFILPNDALFVNDTAEIDAPYKPMLNVLADFMQSYAKISVKVTGHCNRMAEDEITKFGKLSDQLTERQAAAVASYLVSRHIDARFVYAVGRGNRDPIAWEGSRQGRQLNRRVEVSFRYYRDNTAWY